MSLTDVHRATIHKTVEAVWRIESAKIIASLTRITRDVGIAEELAQDALVVALEQWPESGLPDNPGAWLMATAKRRAIDRFRRNKLLDRKHEELGRELKSQQDAAQQSAHEAMADFDFSSESNINDDLLRLVFISCHPILSTDARVALTLRLLGGLTTAEIARAFLTPEPTIAQRIVRAKKTLSEAHIPFEVPRAEDRADRLSSVLEVIYLIFNEGYAATAGEKWIRDDLCTEAVRLGRVLAELTPQDPEVHGLVALMEIQSSRFAARTNAEGEPILLLEQNRALWDQLLIRRGLAALDRAEKLAAVPQLAEEDSALGPYALQAAIAACHARAHTADQTDWSRIAELYELLARVTASPIVELNRAVAVAMADGPAAGLALVDELTREPALKGYHLLPSVRGDLLQKLGRQAEAREEFERAAAMTQNAREKELLLKRAGKADS